MVNFDELRKEVALRHNILLGKDDPILVTVTLNDIVLNRYLELLAAQNKGYSLAITAALQQQTELAKATASRIITDASDYVAVQVRQAVATSLADAGAQIKMDIAEVKAASREALAGSQTAHGVRMAAMIAAGVAGACAIIALVAMVVVLVK